MKNLQLDIFREIVVDHFAGGGGASNGIEMATGLSVDIAINHDPAAIAMHKANHPDTEHYCESVWDVDPVKAVKGRKVGLAWFSPDCKHFSKAKGGKPVEKRIRGLAWIAVRWAATVKPRVIMLENVEEFKTWGPLLKDGRPDPDKKGKTFKVFVNALKKQGYKVDWKELRACDFGAPTIRKRLFLIARCDGHPIVWPKPTHGDPKSEEVRKGKLKPWRSAAEIIDWSIPSPSIFDRKKPLAENTLRRIARGIKRFVFDNPDPFIVRVNHSGSSHHYCDSINEPLKTITSKNGWGLVTPYITKIGQTGFGGDRLQYSLEQSLTTITTKAEHCLVTPFLAQYHTETQKDEVRGQTLDSPIYTLDTSNRYALVSAFIVRQFGASTGHEMDSPLGTITTVNKSNLVTAFLMKYYGSDIGQQISEPLHTVTTKDRFGLVTIKGKNYQIVDIGMRMLQPHELFAAQGFPENYIIDRDCEGNVYSKAKQVTRCGNAVPPPFAEALVRANLPEMCVDPYEYKPAVSS
ncbi:DNA cytosine methyltransferase [Heyndrickxia sp. NPDC080065]|uniref:DNA cytosine methyltransferase n=1 Tax=Heyndrickxia sp. NPDC080065 TaxID=3390568 RepID=UPI003D011896